MATEILKDLNLFVNENKIDFAHVHLTKSGVKEEQGKFVAAMSCGERASLLVLCYAARKTSLVILV